MHFQVYLPDREGEFLNNIVKNSNIKRNDLVRRAIKEWAINHNNLQWDQNTFNFESLENIPEFSSYRNELKSPSEAIF